MHLGTTNRKQDLDKALLSRFDVMIKYDLPDFEARKQIFKRYAKQFNNDNNNNNYDQLANASIGLSCRDIKDSCKQAERSYASQLIRSLNTNEREVKNFDIITFPTLNYYIQSINQRIDRKQK